MADHTMDDYRYERRVQELKNSFVLSAVAVWDVHHNPHQGGTLVDKLLLTLA
jgi:hypothetical protein